jgi:hypothetical protein
VALGLSQPDRVQGTLSTEAHAYLTFLFYFPLLIECKALCLLNHTYTSPFRIHFPLPIRVQGTLSSESHTYLTFSFYPPSPDRVQGNLSTESHTSSPFRIHFPLPIERKAPCLLNQTHTSPFRIYFPLPCRWSSYLQIHRLCKKALWRTSQTCSIRMKCPTSCRCVCL